MTHQTNINIETLILVTAWKNPSIFQGCFKFRCNRSQKKQFLMFRCECNKANPLDIIERDFTAEDYHFTHLYRETQPIYIDKTQNNIAEPILYLLKYALDISLRTMVLHHKQKITYIDEVAMQTLAAKIKPILNQCTWVENDGEKNHLGFAVAVDFHPTEATGEAAASDLLNGTFLDMINHKMH